MSHVRRNKGWVCPVSTLYLHRPTKAAGTNKQTKEPNHNFSRRSPEVVAPHHMRTQNIVPMLRTCLLSAMATMSMPGKRRLETREEVARLAANSPSGTKVNALLTTRVKSALGGRVLLGEQPAQLRTGLSVDEDRTRIEVVDQHFSYAPLDTAAEAALARDLEQIGATLAQGLGLRNQLYGEKQRAHLARLTRDTLPTKWAGLPASAAACGVPPLDVLRTLLSTKPTRKVKLSPKLTNAFVEAIVEAHANAAPLSANAIAGAKRLRRLPYPAIRAVKMAARRLEADADFWPAAAWACANDLQGQRKQHSQRRSRAVERLAIRRLRAAGVIGRTEKALRKRTTTPDFIVDGALPSGVCARRVLETAAPVRLTLPRLLASRQARQSASVGLISSIPLAGEMRAGSHRRWRATARTGDRARWSSRSATQRRSQSSCAARTPSGC